MQTWGLTDPGNIRQQNQDSYAIVPFGRDRVLMIVCDGMGGAKSGNVASSLAVEVFTDEVRRTQRPGMTPEKAAAMLRSALELSNSAVYEQSQLRDDFNGMGTTLVAAWISRDLAVVINVGDSRAYRVGTGRLERITRDHSVVEGLIESGNITAEQARTHPNRNLITRALGPEEHIECDVYDVTLGADERLLLCADGLVVTATDEEMYEAVGRGDTPEESLEHLLELSKQRGAPDNVTAVLLYHE